MAVDVVGMSFDDYVLAAGLFIELLGGIGDDLFRFAGERGFSKLEQHICRKGVLQGVSLHTLGQSGQGLAACAQRDPSFGHCTGAVLLSRLMVAGHKGGEFVLRHLERLARAYWHITDRLGPFGKHQVDLV